MSVLAQVMRFKVSLEDESVYLFDESCAYSNECNQNMSLIYFRKRQVSSLYFPISSIEQVQNVLY